MSSEKWETRRLGEICTKIGSGATPRGGQDVYLDDGPVALIRSQNVLDFSFSYDGLAYIDEPQAALLSNVEVEAGDVLLNITGDSVARVCQAPRELLPARVNQHVAIIRPDRTRLDAQFLKYFLLNPRFKNQMLAYSFVGATRKALTKGMIEGFDIALPPLFVQRRIASILSALDDKIELNRQTNATLEAIAQAIFKAWFVDFEFPVLNYDSDDFTNTMMAGGANHRASRNQTNHSAELVESALGLIPAGWRVGRLGDVCENRRQTVHPNSIASDTAYVGLEHIPRKSLTLDAWGSADEVDSQKTHFLKWDILFGKLRPYFHKVCIAPVDGICSTDILVMKPVRADFFAFCLSYLFSNEVIAYVSVIADGTRMPRVDWQSISNYQIAIPPDSLLIRFNAVVEPLYRKLLESSQESRTLAQIRDALLPRLMRGEVVV